MTIDPTGEYQELRTEKFGLSATPVSSQVAVADATDAASVILRLNELLARLRTMGIILT